MKKLLLLLVFLFLVPVLIAQNNPSNPPPQQRPPVAQPGQQEKEPEHKVTPEEAKELFQSVDEILQFASKSTLLPMKQPVKKAMVSREQVEKYIEDKFKNDVDRIRFERSELVLKKFGFLPRTFDLHTFMIKLLGEQVEGYYDEKTKTINLLDWVGPDMQKPVLAHELTHALQDQSFDLGKMIKKEEEIEKRGPSDYNALIKTDEESACRTAVLEGQAMIVLVDYILAPAGRSVEDSPSFVDMMQSSMNTRGDSPLFDNAPLLLREELVFPYSHGMKFIQELLKAGGKKLAFTGVLSRMPETTREILEPKEYLAGRRIPALMLPDMSFLKKDFEPFDAGAVGEFDVEILLKQYADEETAKRLAPEWRGGAYYAAGRKGTKPANPNSTDHIGLVYVSRWSSDKVAQEFAHIYASALPSRYSKLDHLAASPTTPGREKYMSNDGPIFLEQHGDVLIVTESFDDTTADRLIQAAQKQVQENSKAVKQSASTQQ
ncbi:MAG TPA: hypothetical protein VHA33_29625 [Candidatus Angelobacter sp.]|jgi:hypothetical protein|nr:hypothetical protein [Candidatus Angelobacter sp.]